MINIFTKISLSTFVFANITTLLVLQTVTAKQLQTKKQMNQAIPRNSELRIYPANNNLPESRLIPLDRVTKKFRNIQITEAKLTTYQEFAAKMGLYKSSISTNRMVWIVTYFVQGELRMSKGRSICTDRAKIVEVIDAETGDSFGRAIHCPQENEIDFMAIPKIF